MAAYYPLLLTAHLLCAMTFGGAVIFEVLILGSGDIGLIMAALLLAMLPILILYLFLQRYIVEGVTSGAVKG